MSIAKRSFLSLTFFEDLIWTSFGLGTDFGLVVVNGLVFRGLEEELWIWNRCFGGLRVVVGESETEAYRADKGILSEGIL